MTIRQEEAKIRVRMIREIRQDVIDFGRSHSLTLPVDLELHAYQITDAGNALVGLALDDPIILPVGSFVVVDDEELVDFDREHRAMTEIRPREKASAECVRCDWRFASDDPAEVIRAAKAHRTSEGDRRES